MEQITFLALVQGLSSLVQVLHLSSLNTNGSFNDRKTAPFIFFRGGTLFHTGGDDENDNYNQYYYPKDYRGGASLAIGTGISWAKEDLETYLSFAYRYAQTSYKQRITMI